MINKLQIWWICLLLSLLISCGGVKAIRQVDRYDDFLQKTRLIMLKTEIEIYKHLSDEQAKESFREEFWQKRDPDTSTPGNEAEEEFNRRIEYVNRWFCEGVGKNRCLNSDRGKVYILLGEPDERSTDRSWVIDRFGKRMKVLKEIWLYTDHRLYLSFIDREGFGEYRLLTWSTELLRAIDEAKFAIYQDDQSKKYDFKFSADFEDNKINIKIPVKGITFNERDNQVLAKFEINIHVYLNYKKITTLDKIHNLSGSKSGLLKKKNIDFSIPYPLESKGIYYFEIIIKDVNSLAKYRETVKKKA